MSKVRGAIPYPSLAFSRSEGSSPIALLARPGSGIQVGIVEGLGMPRARNAKPPPGPQPPPSALSYREGAAGKALLTLSFLLPSWNAGGGGGGRGKEGPENTYPHTSP